jgi:hypothetical protein
MAHYQPAPEGKDPHLWEIAQRRASFKTHFLTYIIVNAFLWALWYFNNNDASGSDYPWPIWPTLGWGIGIAFHFAGAYVFQKANSIENEYEKLKNKQ